MEWHAFFSRSNTRRTGNVKPKQNDLKTTVLCGFYSLKGNHRKKLGAFAFCARLLHSHSYCPREKPSENGLS
ncbi:hypothetical protein EMIT048CA2_50068 [Pseudomonas chlororaphis]